MYTWSNQFYRDFMVDLMRMLEPYYSPSQTQIVTELDEISSLVFVMQGRVGLGFEINKQLSFCRYFENNCIIGAYGITFNQRSAYIYNGLTACTGYFIRKLKWHELLRNNNNDIATVLKHHILMDYLMNIRAKVELKKKDFKAMFQQRADHQIIHFNDNKFERFKVWQELYELNKDKNNEKQE